MGAQVVQEDDDLVVTGRLPQLVQPFNEAICIDRPLEYHKWFQAVFLGDAGQHGKGRFLQPGQVNSRILILATPLDQWYRSSREHGLIGVHRAIAVVPGLCQSPPQVGHQLSGHLVRLPLRLLVPLILLLFDAMQFVNSSQCAGF